MNNTSSTILIKCDSPKTDLTLNVKGGHKYLTTHCQDLRIRIHGDCEANCDKHDGPTTNVGLLTPGTVEIVEVRDTSNLNVFSDALKTKLFYISPGTNLNLDTIRNEVEMSSNGQKYDRIALLVTGQGKNVT